MENTETRIKSNLATYVCDDEALEVTEDVEVVGDSAPPTKITAAPPPLDLSLDIAPKWLLLLISSFLAARVTSGDSGRTFRKTWVMSDLTTVVITSLPPLRSEAVAKRVGMDIASRPLPGSSEATPIPSLRVGLGSCTFVSCLGLRIGEPGSEDGPFEEAEASFQRPDCKELQRFLMYGAHLSILKQVFNSFFFWDHHLETLHGDGVG